MSCNAAIYTVNSARPTLAENSQISFGSVIRRFGRNCQLDGDSIQLYGSGYYDFECSCTLMPEAAGDISVQLYQDGVAVPGAFATAVAAAAGDPVNLGITALCRVCGCDCNSSLVLMVDGAATLVNLATVVEKI